MKPTYRLTAVTTVLAAVMAAGNAAAQCPSTVPQDVINSMRNPEARAAAQAMRVDASMIAQAGGLPAMIAMVKGQIAADRATAEEEHRNQTYLAQQGMGNDRRALQGGAVIQTMEDAQRLNTAFLQVLECHARQGASGTGMSNMNEPGLGASGMGAGGDSSARSTAAAFSPGGAPGGIPGGTEMLPGVARTPSMAAAAASARSAFASGGVSGVGTASSRPAQPGADLGQALDNLSRTLRQKALANASPEVAAFYAKQDAMRANTEANMAAVSAGQSRGLGEARKGSIDAQLKMVTGVVKGWRPPNGYARSAAIDSSAIQDPFAAAERLQGINVAVGASGLAWNHARGLARVGDNRSLCGGRLRDGDYPVLADGSLLDTPARIAQFLAACSDASLPVLVVRESGDVEVRK